VPFETASASLLGDRAVNQDRCAVYRESGSVLLLLSDGMGGHPRGEVAAQILMDTGRTSFAASPKPIEHPPGFLDDVLRCAHQEIVAYGHAQEPPIDPRATAVGVLVQDGQAYWTHAGDSRLYLIRDHRVIRRTRDHSFIEQMRGHGILDLGAKAAKRYRNLVTQCLGGAGMRFGTTRGQPTRLRAGDLLLLCTDGLWGQFPEERLIDALRGQDALEHLVNRLVRSAVASASPSSDNVTLVALRWLGDDARPAAEPPPETPPAETATAETSTDDLQQAIELLRGAIEDFESGKS
jgi:serine/threonine protein phosphatase PrpC